MGSNSPFGSKTRHAILESYFRTRPDSISPADAWKDVYRLLLWIDQGTGLAHVYDANHMQKGGGFHGRAIKFTDALCRSLGVSRADLRNHIDVLFKGCVAEYRKQREAEPVDADLEQELRSELLVEVREAIASYGVSLEQAEKAARDVEKLARDFFTVENKRKNALGEGFEDVLARLLLQTAMLPRTRVRTRSKLFDLPGFRKAAPVMARGGKPERLPKPDIAIVDDEFTYAVVTAKWSMRQDRERQFANEYVAYTKNLVQKAEVRFFLITNEFDLARLDNVARAQPDGAGYLFHTIFHVNLDLLKATHGVDLSAGSKNPTGRAVAGWIGAGKIASLDDFLATMAESYGVSEAETPDAGKKRRRG